MLFESLAPEIVKRSILQLAEQALNKRERYREMLEDFYLGDISAELIRFPAETDDEFADRLRRIQYPNYVGLIANKLIEGAYGKPVKREMVDASPQQTDKLQEILRRNSIAKKQLEYAQSVVVLGEGWTRYSYDVAVKEGLGVSVHPVYPGHIAHYAYDPDSPTTLAEVVEREVVEGWAGVGRVPVAGYWVWTREEYAKFDREGNLVLGPERNVYGRVPSVRWYGRPVVGQREGDSYISDLITLARAIINRMSELDVLVRDQAHGTLVAISYDDLVLPSGPKRGLKLMAGAGADAKYIQPGADIAAVLASLDRLIEQECETAGVPRSLLHGGIASSGVQLELEMAPYTAKVETIRSVAEQSEVEQVELICAVSNAFGGGMPVDPQVKIAYDPNILPADKTAERNWDLARVNNFPPLMTIESFLRKYEPGLDTPDALAEYVATLRAQGSSSGGGFGGKTNQAPEEQPPAPPDPYVPPTPPGGGKIPPNTQGP